MQKLLNKLLVPEFTKSRANRTTDNALVEGKNGAVVRKHIGHEPIGGPSCRRGAALLHGRNFNPYLNYHRPCGFATIELSDNGKRRRRYRLNDYRTPYEKLLSLNDWESYLKEGVSAARLEQQALRMSDTECALRMQQRKRKLLGRLPRAALELPRCLQQHCPQRGLTAPDSTLRGGGKGKLQETFVVAARVCTAAPSPLPPSPLEALDPLRKEILTLQPALFRLGPFQAHPWIGKCCGLTPGNDYPVFQTDFGKSA